MTKATKYSPYAIARRTGLRHLPRRGVNAARPYQWPLPVRPPVLPRNPTRVRPNTAEKNKIHRKAKELPNRSGSESTLTIKLRPKGMLSKLEGKLQNSTYTVNSQDVLQSTTGLQGTQSVGNYNIFTQYTLNKILGACANQLSVYGGDYRSNAINCFVKSAFMETQLLNSSNGVVRMQIWDCMARRDCYEDRTGIQMSPVYCWADGIKEQTASGTGQEVGTVGARPTDSNEFNKYWKVKRVTYLELAPGQVHYHRIHYRINRRITNDIVQNTALWGVKGWTLVPMFVFYGEPINDNAGGVTVAGTKILTITNTDYHFTYLAASTSISQQNNNLSITAATGGAIENLVTGASAAFSTV